MTREIDRDRCPACDGTGDDLNRPKPSARCTTCGGSGRLSPPEQWDPVLDAVEARHAPPVTAPLDPAAMRADADEMLRLLGDGRGEYAIRSCRLARHVLDLLRDRDALAAACLAVAHQLEAGEASEGDRRDLAWCARTLRDALAPPAAGGDERSDA